MATSRAIVVVRTGLSRQLESFMELAMSGSSLSYPLEVPRQLIFLADVIGVFLGYVFTWWLLTKNRFKGIRSL